MLNVVTIMPVTIHNDQRYLCSGWLCSILLRPTRNFELLKHKMELFAPASGHFLWYLYSTLPMTRQLNYFIAIFVIKRWTAH